jgi:hypothetical protein
MFMAAAKALAAASPARNDPNKNLLPPVTSLREVSITVALAVALQAHKEGLTQGVETDEIEELIRSKIWTPHYLPYQPIWRNAKQADQTTGVLLCSTPSSMDCFRSRLSSCSVGSRLGSAF